MKYKVHITVPNEALYGMPLCGIAKNRGKFFIPHDSPKTILKHFRNKRRLCMSCRRIYNKRFVTRKVHFL